METSLKKTPNKFRAVGTVYETSLKLGDGEVNIYEDGKPVGKEPCKRINGKVSLRTNDGIFTFSAFFNSLDNKGKESAQWTMAQSMLDWIPEVGEPINKSVAQEVKSIRATMDALSAEELKETKEKIKPTKVSITGNVNMNDWLSPTGNVVSNLQWNIGKASRKGFKPEESGCSLDAIGMYYKVRDEVYNDEETGRKIVTFMLADYKGACYPVDIVFDGEDFDVAEEIMSIGDTVSFSADQVSRHVGSTKTQAENRFKRKSAVETTSGFDVTELVITGVGDPIPEPEEMEDEDGNPIASESYWINPKAMKKAVAVREEMLKELKGGTPKTKPSAPASGKSGSIKEKKNSSKINKEKPKKFMFDDDEDEEDGSILSSVFDLEEDDLPF